MDEDVVVDLERFLWEGHLWDRAELSALVTRLDRRTDDVLAQHLARFVRAVAYRIGAGEIPVRVRDDMEAIAYPRLWKLVEAARAGLPTGELLCRVQVMNRRLSRLLADELV